MGSKNIILKLLMVIVLFYASHFIKLSQLALEAEIIRDFNGQEYYEIKDIRSGGDLVANEADLIKGCFTRLKKIFKIS